MVVSCVWNKKESRFTNLYFLHIDPQVGGGNTAKIHSPDNVANPLLATTWKYASNDEWTESIDILIGKGMYWILLFGQIDEWKK